MRFGNAVFRLHSCFRVSVLAVGLWSGSLEVLCLPQQQSGSEACCSRIRSSLSLIGNHFGRTVSRPLLPLTIRHSFQWWGYLSPLSRALLPGVEIPRKSEWWWEGGLVASELRIMRILQIQSVAKLVWAILWKITSIDDRFCSLLFY